MTVIGTAEACGRYLPGVPRRRCEGTTFEYRTGSYQDVGHVQYTASRKCLACGGTSRVDVSYEVPRVVKTAEQWATFWAKIDARPA